MNEHSPIKVSGSLLQRASELFDFGRIIAENAPDTSMPPFVETPAAAPEQTISSTTSRRPAFAGREARVDRAALAGAGFILPDTPAGALGEEFRLIKRQLLLEANGGADGQSDPRSRTILIASARPNEGKTFCAINLALSMAAEKDVEVLLVDADFAKPEILAVLGIENGPGLMDVLADPARNVEDCIVRTDIAGLYVLPAGQQTNSDTEWLASEHSRSVIESLLASNPSRIVILDSPPALAASPASVLALHAGQCIMVVKADRTSEADLRDALGLLQGCEHIQLLLNAVSYPGNARRFSGYYGQAR